MLSDIKCSKPQLNIMVLISHFISAFKLMVKKFRIFQLLIFSLVTSSASAADSLHLNRISYVNPMLGTNGSSNILPVASAPFGMVQLGADTHLNNAGYKYNADEIIGFSHTHMSGGGCNDFKDIMFFPINDPLWIGRTQYPQRISEKFSHNQELAEPGYYKVKLLNSKIDVELTATERCGLHRYSYPKDKPQQMIIDLKYGHNSGCTVCPKYDYDTVRTSFIKVINDHTIIGYRISDGWLNGVNVYFHAEFSKRFTIIQLYENNQLKKDKKELMGRNVRLFIQFDENDGKPVVARTGISPVSVENAMNNLESEVKTWDFDLIKNKAQQKWEKELSAVEINDTNSVRKRIFYTLLYRSLFYPALYSDVNGEFRSSDNKVHKGDFKYLAGALGLWDTFRAQNPLISILRPDIANDLMKTFIAHFNYSGQLPQWTGAGIENWCMIGLPANSIIADVYRKNIRGYDVAKLYEAMKVSANVDTFGFSEGNGVHKGTILYKKYGFIPCEMDINSVSKSLEFNYSDWCLAQMAKMLEKKEDYNFYMNRSRWYKNLYDPITKLMRPKYGDGSWKAPFDPVFSNHYHQGDDYCEGTAYQWTFFVPHDPLGLANLMGGNEIFEQQLDSLFIRSSVIHTGGEETPDMSEKDMIGQYAHSNEPCHHIIYFYNSIGKPWKTQKWISSVMSNLYEDSFEGLCGNDDTGQMSAWYIFNAMGFYPVTHGSGVYYIGTPLFKDMKLKHKNGILSIKANNISKQNIYIKSVTLNGKPYLKNWLKHEKIFNGDVELIFDMDNIPNKDWGSSKEMCPPSMIGEKYDD